MPSVTRHSLLALFRAALVVALLTALALALAYQVRSRVRVDVGNAYDKPFVARFFDAEDDGTQTYRWTRDTSRIELDAQGLATPWTLRVRLNGYRPQGAARVDALMNGVPIDTFRAQDGWHEYEFQGNAAGDFWSGNNLLLFKTDTFVPQKEIQGSSDTRKLGAALDWVELMPQRSSAALGSADVWVDFGALPVMPPWGTLASWAVGCALLYVSARVIGVAPKISNLAAAALVVLVALGFAFARVWLGYYTASFLTLAITLAVFAVLLVVLLPRLAVHFALALDARALTFLSAMILTSVALKWGGAWYPQFHSSDLLFHAHRLEFVAQGNLLFTSELPDAARRVVPYPPALYIALAPLTIFSQAYAALLVVFNALADAAAILCIYFAARKLEADAKRQSKIENRKFAYALFAAFLVAFNPVSFWIYSWGNHTNIFAQAAATILFALLLTVPLTRPRNFLLALFLFLLAALGHLGVFLSLLAFLPLVILFRFMTREAAARREALAFGALLLGGIGLSWLWYYAEFSEALFKQAQIFAVDFGAGRAAGSGVNTAARVLDVGRYTVEQLGVVLILLGLAGIPLAWKKFEKRARAVWSAWLLVGGVFALITIGAAFSTRYTLWSAPALALSGAFVLVWLSEKSRAARWLAYALCAGAFLQTLWLWLDRVWNAYH